MLDIKHFANRQLEMRDLGDAVQFVVRPHFRWRNIAMRLAVVLGFALWAWWWHSVIMMIFAIVGVIGMISNGVRGRHTTLRVNRAEIVARGDLDMSAREITVPLTDITSMGWNAGGQDDSGGLYVANGWTRSYVVPGATEAQAREILATITGRFPGFPIDEKTWASLIWGDESVLMEIGVDEEKQREGSRAGDSKT